MKSQELTAADHVVVFETESQARQMLETANAYKRTAILVQNLEGETYIVGVFKGKKDAIEEMGNLIDNRNLAVVTRNAGTHNVSFYNLIGLANAIIDSANDGLVDCEYPHWYGGIMGKLYAKIETPESQPVIQEIPESQEVVEIVDKPVASLYPILNGVVYKDETGWVNEVRYLKRTPDMKSDWFYRGCKKCDEHTRLEVYWDNWGGNDGAERVYTLQIQRRDSTEGYDWYNYQQLCGHAEQIRQQCVNNSLLEMAYKMALYMIPDFAALPIKPIGLAPAPTLIGIFEAQKIVRLAKSDTPVYAVAKSIDESERDDGISHNVLYVTMIAERVHRFVLCDQAELSEACRLIEIRKDELFVFEELDCEAVTYAATVDARWIMHPNGRWKIYFHDERPDDASDCSQFEFNGWDLNGEEYRIELGFGDTDENRDERIVWRIYAKDIEWDGKTRDLVCICRHPDALPEDDMGYKRPPANPHSVSPMPIPWLATENMNEEYEYAY